MTDSRRLIAFGVVDIVTGLIIWGVSDNATLGLAFVLAGVAVLAVAAFRGEGSTTEDPAAARRNEQADEQRQRGATDAGTENLEDRPPATGA